ncbi:MAG: hypothetical protein KBG15_23290, partial [Kofleriaceae bacterium]|nr:hypothetical protein [Kofleriaceae bacterium]
MFATLLLANWRQGSASYAAPVPNLDDDPDAAAEQISAVWSSALDPQGRNRSAAVAKALRSFNDQDYQAARATLQTVRN